jgi:DNA-binding NtrC family response regulator
MMKKILIIDDEEGARESLKTIFKFDYEVHIANSGKKGLRILAKEDIQLVLLDVIMPEQNGIEVLKIIQELYPETTVLMVSASNTIKPVVEAIREGALDYITKPYDVDAIRLAVARALQTSQLQRKVEALECDVSREFPTTGIIGSSDALHSALAQAKKAAKSEASVLISGDSGTGKELVARYVHNMSARHDQPFVATHCASLPDNLMEAELFGYEKGAFTGADKRKLGRFDMAANGTLFFDEVSEMTLNTQVKLLRVLQEKEFMRVGGTKEVQTDARIIAACNRDLATEIAEKRFRDDLFYRLNVVPISLPSLRERTEDIPILAEYFVQFFRQSMDVKVQGFGSNAIDIMMQYKWPGNIRELKNIVERMLVLHGDEKIIQAQHLPEELGGGPVHQHHEVTVSEMPNSNLEEAVNAYEKQLVERALRDAKGVQTRAAEILGTTRRILKYRMEKLNIEMADIKS